jgi:hypothetical protein
VNDPATLVRAVGDGSRTDPCGGVDYDLNPIQDVILVQDRYRDTQVVSTAPCWANELTGQRRYPSRSLAERVARLLSCPPLHPHASTTHPGTSPASAAATDLVGVDASAQLFAGDMWGGRA